MQLRITHTTGYEYDAKAVTSYNEARLTPQTSPEQIVVHSRLDVSPTPWVHTYRDYWGTQVTSFEVLDPHDALTVSAAATVHVDRGEQPGPQLEWSDLADDAVADVHTEHLMISPLVAPHDDLRAAAADVRGRAARPAEAAREICELVYRRLRYVPGSTEVHGTAAEAWELGSGVCQDMTHAAIGALRSIGIPTRYVSGYLHPDVDAGVGVAVEGESHAWVEWWDDGWRAFDVTNDQPIGDRHVVIAAGRDYTDVRPLSGIFSGAQTSRMFVSVEVTRLA